MYKREREREKEREKYHCAVQKSRIIPYLLLRSLQYTYVGAHSCPLSLLPPSLDHRTIRMRNALNVVHSNQNAMYMLHYVDVSITVDMYIYSMMDFCSAITIPSTENSYCIFRRKPR